MGLGMSFKKCNRRPWLLSFRSHILMLSSDPILYMQLYSSSDSEVAETDIEVEVSSKTSEQEETSDDDEPEAAYANEPLDENWQAQYEAERQKKQESPVSLLLL